VNASARQFSKFFPTATSYEGYYGGMMGRAAMMRVTDTLPQLAQFHNQCIFTTTPTHVNQYPNGGWGCAA